jgi:DNA-binding transcriptional ArsR family regulator
MDRDGLCDNRRLQWKIGKPLDWRNRTIGWYYRTMSTLADILSSRVKAEVFRLLFGLGESPLHLREIERRSGLAVGTVRQELQRLVSLGLVEKRPDGNRRLYTANRHHPLYPDIRKLVLKTSGLAEVLRAALEQEPAIWLAFVFGTLARGEDVPQMTRMAEAFSSALSA